MPANWTAPALYTAGQLITADDLNRISDNLNALKTPPTASIEPIASYVTTSTAWVDMHTSAVALALTTSGGDLLIGFYGMIGVSTLGGAAYLDVTLDGARLGGTDGLIAHYGNYDTYRVMAFTLLRRGVAAGVHTLRLQWRVSSAGLTATLYGAGANQAPQFWAREV